MRSLISRGKKSPATFWKAHIDGLLKTARDPDGLYDVCLTRGFPKMLDDH